MCAAATGPWLFSCAAALLRWFAAVLLWHAQRVRVTMDTVRASAHGMQCSLTMRRKAIAALAVLARPRGDAVRPLGPPRRC